MLDYLEMREKQYDLRLQLELYRGTGTASWNTHGQGLTFVHFSAQPEPFFCH